MRVQRNLIASTAILALLLLTACGDQKDQGISVNEDRAREHIITLEKADQYIADFASGKEELGRLIPDSNFLDSRFNLPVAEMFNRDAIALLLRQDGADGVRIYLGRDDSGQVRLVLLPVDNQGNDIRKMLITNLQQAAATKAAPPDDGEAIEAGQRCPTLCDGGFQ